MTVLSTVQIKSVIQHKGAECQYSHKSNRLHINIMGVNINLDFG